MSETPLPDRDPRQSVRDEDERPAGHPAQESAVVSAGEVLSDHSWHPDGVVGARDIDDAERNTDDLPDAGRA
jgi:hypothetical protein